MKTTLPLIRTLWIVIASIVTIAVIGREIAWEMRPSVKRNNADQYSRIEAAIKTVTSDVTSFAIDMPDEPDLFFVYDPAIGMPPLMRMDYLGNLHITATRDQLRSPEIRKSFVNLCKISSVLKTGYVPDRFDDWVKGIIDETSVSLAVKLDDRLSSAAMLTATNTAVEISVIN